MTFILENYRFFSAKIADCLDNDTLDRESLLGASSFRLHDKYEITTNMLATHFLANASTNQLDRFIRLFKDAIDPLLCEKVFTLKITQAELLEMLEAVLKEFSILELCRLVPALGLTNLLNELRYFAGDAILDALRDLFEAHPDTDGGFAFDDEGRCPVLEIQE